MTRTLEQVPPFEGCKPVSRRPKPYLVRRILLTVLALFAAAPASAALATTYYVSPGGSDSNPGTADAPWRTVARVDDAQLAPGDAVRFQGGAQFTDAPLMPPASGAPDAPILFGSYGAGAAQIANPDGAVWIPQGRHDLVFDSLDLSSSNAIVFASAADGPGVTDVVLRDSTIHDSPYAGLTNQPQDARWTIRRDAFSHLGDSGLIVQADAVAIERSTIVDTGWNPALDYGKHGIYGKAPDLTIANDDISQNANGSAISLRYHGARVVGNAIHDTRYAVSFFPQDPVNAGSAEIRRNRMWNISGFAFYYAGVTSDGRPAGIDVSWIANTVELAGADEAVNLSELTVPRAVVANNVFTGSYGSAYRGCPRCREFDNDWFGASFNLPSGRGDLFAFPALSDAPTLAPTPTSPVVDAGAVSPGGVVYAPACDGAAWHFCGAAPDLGAVEFDGGGRATASVAVRSGRSRPGGAVGAPHAAHGHRRA